MINYGVEPARVVHCLTLYGPGFLMVPGPGKRVVVVVVGGGGGRGGWRKAASAYNSKTIHGIEMKFGSIVENHKLV